MRVMRQVEVRVQIGPCSGTSGRCWRRSRKRTPSEPRSRQPPRWSQPGYAQPHRGQPGPCGGPSRWATSSRSESRTPRPRTCETENTRTKAITIDSTVSRMAAAEGNRLADGDAVESACRLPDRLLEGSSSPRCLLSAVFRLLILWNITDSVEVRNLKMPAFPPFDQGRPDRNEGLCPQQRAVDNPSCGPRAAVVRHRSLSPGRKYSSAPMLPARSWRASPAGWRNTRRGTPAVAQSARQFLGLPRQTAGSCPVHGHSGWNTAIERAFDCPVPAKLPVHQRYGNQPLASGYSFVSLSPCLPVSLLFPPPRAPRERMSRLQVPPGRRDLPAVRRRGRPGIR